MIYPREFVEKVRAEYSDREEVVELAETNRYALGTHLSRGAMAAYEETSSQEDSRVLRRRLLHAEWMRIVLRSIAGMLVEAPPASRRRPYPQHSLSMA